VGCEPCDQGWSHPLMERPPSSPRSCRWGCPGCPSRVFVGFTQTPSRLHMDLECQLHHGTGTQVFSFHCPQRNPPPPRMQETESQDVYGRVQVDRRWYNGHGNLHRTTGPAVEHWILLPSGARVLSGEAWFLNGTQHREGRPATRDWHVVDDGTRVLWREKWCRHGMDHRVGGPTFRDWIMEPDSTRTLSCMWWHRNGIRHGADGTVCYRRGLSLDRTDERPEHMQWLRRGWACLAALAAATTGRERAYRDVIPAWSLDA